MHDVWFVLCTVMFAGYGALAGFDLGATSLSRAFKRPEERATIMRAIGPYWDASEVWLIAGAGTFLLAFPRAFAAVLSGFYLPVFFATWSLVLRGLSIELRHHSDSDLWHAFFDGLVWISSIVFVILLGVVVGNLLRGVPIGEDGTFALPLFGHGVLDGYTIVTGMAALAILLAHGATFLAWKTEIAAFGWPMYASASVLWLIAVARTKDPSIPMVIACALPLAFTIALSYKRMYRWAFLASCTFVIGCVVGVAVTLHPHLIRSTTPHTLDVGTTLTTSGSIALRWWPLMLLLALAWMANLFRIHRGKVAVEKSADH